MLLALVVAGAAWMTYQRVGRSGGPPVQLPAPAHVNARELRFPPDSAQLTFVKTEAVQALPEPLLEPLSARIAYDENHTARIASPIAGRVTRILAQPGDQVKAGQHLLLLDSPDFASAAADAAKSRADFQLKEKAYARSRELYNAEVIARKDFEAAETELQQSAAEQTRARMRLRNLDPGVTDMVGGYALRSPLAGIVAERSVNPGSEVRPDGPNPLFVITDPAHLWVLVDLPERNLGALRAGQDVEVEVDAYPEQRFHARVAAVGEVLDPATRRVQVRCVLDNPQHLLKPEMYARVTPLADSRVKLPRIPNSALLTVGLYSYVFVEKEPGVFERRQVTLGLQGRSESYVRQGLAGGDRVVTAGALLLNSELAGVE
ncbi:MAG TPA: efflux RND transporter periplasmic adaptor subunit [Burkholderiales bacterium]|nr:efflux RND transporter periplasmic adaptor subunit [Burkholderiales bacterium]